jgi:hypothetical protein
VSENWVGGKKKWVHFTQELDIVQSGANPPPFILDFGQLLWKNLECNKEINLRLWNYSYRSEKPILTFLRPLRCNDTWICFHTIGVYFYCSNGTNQCVLIFLWVVYWELRLTTLILKIGNITRKQHLYITIWSWTVFLVFIHLDVRRMFVKVFMKRQFQ